MVSSSINSISDIPKEGKIFFCGIGGSAMNAMASLLVNEGFIVSGSDPGINNAVKKRLNELKIDVFLNQDGSNITGDIDLIVATAAVDPHNAELIAAQNRNIPVVKYSKMLGLIMDSKHGIAVAGTHGKTTTSSLMIKALLDCGLAPGFVIGGFVSEFGAGAKSGDSNLFVAEACEYDRSFLNLHPEIGIITNIEVDHLDIYKDIDDIKSAFSAFVANIRPEGTLIYCAQNSNALDVAQSAGCKKISYGFDSFCDVRAVNMDTANGFNRFDVLYNGKKVTSLSLLLPGGHNILNSLAVMAAGIVLNLDLDVMSAALTSFKGAARRFDILGTKRGVTVIDDYAHHPTEIRALLKGVKERYSAMRIVVNFQPHQISRTAVFFDEFAAAFSDADFVFVSDIYAARDKNFPKWVTGSALSDKIAGAGVRSSFSGDLNSSLNAVADFVKDGDVFLTVGAGDIFKVAADLMNRLSS